MYFGQLSAKVDKLYKKLSENAQVESIYEGYFLQENPIYRCYMDLKNIATDKELEYMAHQGNPVAKTYAGKIIFLRKSKSLQELFTFFLKNNEQVAILEGCIGSDSFLADELYKLAFREKIEIDRTKWKHQRNDSIIKAGGKTDKIVFPENNKTLWTETEIDSLLVGFEQAVLNNLSSSKTLVELLAENNFYSEIKRPYYQKLIYFEERYHSEMIEQYIDFCSK